MSLTHLAHDLNMTDWGTTTLRAIDAIRSVTTEHYILISGTQFARLTDWMDYSEATLTDVYQSLNDSKILFDFHQYFDDERGAYGVCEPWSTFVPSFEAVTTRLRALGARGMITEFGGAPVHQCVELFEGLLGFLANSTDVWLGWTAWTSPGVLQLSTNATDPRYTLTAVMRQFAPSGGA